MLLHPRLLRIVSTGMQEVGPQPWSKCDYDRGDAYVCEVASVCITVAWCIRPGSVLPVGKQAVQREVYAGTAERETERTER